jgi:multidrug efflux system outer membrane protein
LIRRFVGLTLIAACVAFGQKPAVPMPTALNPEANTASSSPESLGDLRWIDVFHDEALAQLIRTALKDNFDVQLAVNNILQAEQQIKIARSPLFPTINAAFNPSRGLTSPSSLVPKVLGGGATTTTYEFIGSASWEIDLWGKVRHQTKAARETFLASQANRDLVVVSLVYNVAAAYLTLLELDKELEIARQTAAADQQSVELTRIRMDGGVSTMVDVRQAESLAQTAAHAIPLYEQQIRQQEDLINVLIGRNPGKVLRGKTIVEETMPASIPEGLPSSLLERRPDIRLAERQLAASNALVEAARALFFPSISLTGLGGTASRALDNLFSPGTQIWSVVGGLLQPIFQGGKIRANYKLSKLQQEAVVLQYRKTVQEAFREVADALVSVEKLKQARIEQQALTETLRDESELSLVRYQGGVTTFLEVLNAQGQYFSAQGALAQAQRDELLSVVQLYKVLGGGWQQ